MIYALRDRGRALEDRYVYEQTLVFRVGARRARLLGQWAAALLRVADQELYVQTLVGMDLGCASDDEIVTKLRHDFDVYAVTLPEAEMQHRMQDLLVKAQCELEAA
jgi:hypothetical protein